MSDGYFGDLTARAIQFDTDVKILTETWRYPHRVLEGYDMDEKQAEDDLRNLNTIITELKLDIASDAESRTNFMAESRTFLKDFNAQMKELQDSCSDIKTVLSEYGYVPPEVEISPNKSGTQWSPQLVAPDLLNGVLVEFEDNPDVSNNGPVEIEFTPDMKWRRAAKPSTCQGNETWH